MFVVDSETRSCRYEQDGARTSNKLDVERRKQIRLGGPIPQLLVGDAHRGTRGVVPGLATCHLRHICSAIGYICSDSLSSR